LAKPEESKEESKEANPGTVKTKPEETTSETVPEETSIELKPVFSNRDNSPFAKPAAGIFGKPSEPTEGVTKPLFGGSNTEAKPNQFGAPPAE
jgi:hypothetical protein